jgi:hypothetical protein
MPKIKNSFDVEKLAEVFRYDSATGILYRRSQAGNEAPCGCASRTGHMHTKFRGCKIGVHRIAWALHYKEYPEIGIDHINGVPGDNRICNLRLATVTQNSQNTKLSTRNNTGVKNVIRVKCRKKYRWRVSIGVGDKKYYAALFHCFGHAIKHAAQMRLKFYGEFARAS